MPAPCIRRTAARAATAGLAAVLALPVSAGAEPRQRQRQGEVDTEHLFGQTAGADTEEPGAFVPHLVIPGRLGRREGRFVVAAPSLELKYGVVENVSAALSLRGIGADIRNVPGIANHSGLFASGIGLQGRFRLMDRASAPFGLTVQIGGATDQRDTGTGERGRSDQFEARLSLDTEPVFDRFLIGANVYAGTARSFTAGNAGFEASSNLGFGLAAATRLHPNLWVGAEAIYQRAYSGSTFGRLEGDALFIGPTLYAPIEKGWLSVSWTTQVAGREVGGSGRLNLRDFERHQFLVVVGRRF